MLGQTSDNFANLAFTGAESGALAATALTILLAGLFLALASRRRRFYPICITTSTRPCGH